MLILQVLASGGAMGQLSGTRPPMERKELGSCQKDSPIMHSLNLWETFRDIRFIKDIHNHIL